jgi:hypothetical protein
MVFCHILWRLQRQWGTPVLSRDQGVMIHIVADRVERWVPQVYNELINSTPRPGLAQGILKDILLGCK